MTMELDGIGVSLISVDEAAELEGGNLPIAGFLATCFGAGFNFGFNVLGPMMFG